MLTSTGGFITDGAGNVWALVQGCIREPGAPTSPPCQESLVIDVNGSPAGYSADVVELIAVGGVIYQENSAGGWWSWVNGTWQLGSDPRAACGSATDGSSIGPDARSSGDAASSTVCPMLTWTSGSITDRAGNRWTLVVGSDGTLHIDVNAAPAGVSDQVVELIEVGGVIYQENQAGGWWSWTNGNWLSTSDPTAACNDAGSSSSSSGGGGSNAGSVPATGSVYHASLGAICFPGNPCDAWSLSTTVNLRNSIQNFTTEVRKGVHSISTWAGIPSNNVLPIWLDPADNDHSLVPLIQDGTIKSISLMWQPYTDANTDYQTVKDWASGSLDNYINDSAKVVKNFGAPVYIRFGWEMNDYGGTGWSRNPSDFIAAWIHTYNLFKQAGVTNAIWVWNPDCENPGWVYPHPAIDYYPGDQYVDWVGIDQYQSYDAADPEAQMNSIYKDYGDRKPVGIMEWGTNTWNWSGQDTPDQSRANYVNGFFDAVEKRPNVKLIEYLWGNLLHMTFSDAATPLTAAAYRKRISNPRYITGP
jgi:hypothetical protein